MQAYAVVEEHSCDAGFGSDFGELELRVLKSEYRTTEGLSVAGVAQRLLQGRLHRGNCADRHDQAFLRQLGHQLNEALALDFTQQMRPGTRTSSKYSSEVSWPCWPIFFKVRPRRNPGRSASTTINEIPSAPLPGSVLQPRR